MADHLMVGQMLYGFCGGWFGRDSYGDKRVEAVGHDWIVVRNDDGRPQFAHSDYDDDGNVTTDVHAGLSSYTQKEDVNG